MSRNLSFWRISVYVSFSLIVLSGCTTPKPTTDYVVTLTPTQQKAALESSLEKNFEDSQAHYLLGKLYQDDKGWDKAEYEYNLAWRFDPTYWPAQVAMVKLQLDRGDSSKAQDRFETYLKEAANSPDKLDKVIDLGAEFQKEQLDSYALACFQKALDMAPNSAKVQKYLGYYYLSRNDKAKAQECFEQSFNLDKNQPDVARELGRLDVPIKYEGPVPEALSATQ